MVFGHVELSDLVNKTNISKPAYLHNQDIKSVYMYQYNTIPMPQDVSESWAPHLPVCKQGGRSCLMYSNSADTHNSLN